MIYEIRNYFYEPTLMKEYRAWAEGGALDYIRANVDLVGFWVTNDEPNQVAGKPLDDLGSATVTWIIRWPDIETRHDKMATVFDTDEWKEIFKGNPGFEHYLRTEIKFADAI